MAKKKVLIVTEGSRGDHQPYIALAKELQKDYDVHLVVNAGFADFAREQGVESVEQLQFNFKEEAADLMKQVVGVTDLAKMAEMWGPFFDRVFPSRRGELLGMTQGRDLVLASPVIMQFAIPVCESLKIPLILLPLQPHYPSKDRPPIFFDPDNLPPLAEGQTWKDYTVQMMISFLAPFHERFQQWREDLGLKRLTIPEALEDAWTRKSLCGYSAHLVTQPEDITEEQEELVGYWFLTQKEWSPSEELSAWLAKSDEKPLYVGFGSMSIEDPAALTKAVLQSVQNVNARAIICEGWGTLSPPEEYDTDRFFFVKNVYHPGLLPLCSGGVVHGGAGTTAAVVRAGIPGLICPFLADQWFWGATLREKGIGLKGPTATELTEENLTEQLQKLTSTPSLAEKAAEVGALVRGEDSFARVRAYLEQQFK